MFCHLCSLGRPVRCPVPIRLPGPSSPPNPLEPARKPKLSLVDFKYLSRRSHGHKRTTTNIHHSARQF
eukprot:3208097-Alexandrium_andersonii.AAC.1